MPKSRTIPHTTDVGLAIGRMREWFDEPRAKVAVRAGAEAVNVRRFTLQVQDRLSRSWAGRWPIVIFLSASATGTPDATGNTVSWVTGTVLLTHTANAFYTVMTNDSGVAEFDLTIAGAASRYVFAIEMGGGPFEASAEFTWS